ncbi:MAG: hypothetical protein U0359_33320 [Byssovorax sp.]
MLSRRARLALLALLTGLSALSALGCERNPPAAPEQPCACDAQGGRHHSSGRTEIIR